MKVVRKFICEYDICDKEVITGSKIRKYCSIICRSRANQKKYGKEAKEVKCLNCQKPFFRVCARDNKCTTCKEAIRNKDTVASEKTVDIKLRPCTNKENDLIKKFLKQKKG